MKEAALILGIYRGINARSTLCEPRRQEQTGGRICLAARKHGLLTRPILDTIVLMPPLCISEEELRRAVEAIRAGIAEVCPLNGRD